MKRPPDKLYGSLERELGKLDWRPIKDVYEMGLKKIDGMLNPDNYSRTLGKMRPFNAYIRLLPDKKMEKELKEIIEKGEFEDTEYQRKIIYRNDDSFFPMALSRFPDDDSWGSCYTYMQGYIVNPFNHISKVEHVDLGDENYEISILDKDQVLHIWNMQHRDPTIVFHM